MCGCAAPPNKRTTYELGALCQCYTHVSSVLSPAQAAESVPSTPSYQMVPTFQVLANGTAAYQLPPVTYQAGPDINQAAKPGYQAAAQPGTQTIPATVFQQQQTYTVAAAMMPPTGPAVFAATKPPPMSNISMPPAFSNSILQVLRCLLSIDCS